MKWLKNYTELDGVATNGLQYINTGIIIEKGDIITIEVTLPTDTFSSEFIFSDYANGTYGVFSLYIGSNLSFAYFNSEGTRSIVSNLSINRKYTITIVFNDGIDILVDGITERTNVAVDYSYRNPIYLFRQGTSSLFNSHNILNSFKIVHNGVTKNNFIPCVRNSDNTVGLLDLSNNNFLQSNSTTPLIAGNVIPSIIKITNNNISKIYNNNTEIEKIYNR